MEKVKKGVVLILATLLLTGCIKSHTVMSIKNDKSMDFSIEYLISDKLIENGANLVEEFDQSKLKKNGFNFEEIKSNNYSGVKITKSYDDIDNYSTTDGKKVEIVDIVDTDIKNENAGDSVLFKVEKSFLKNKYTATFTYDTSLSDYTSGQENEGLSDETEPNDITTKPEETLESTDGTKTEEPTESSENDMSDLMLLSKEMEYTYTVNLPRKSISNNATEKSNDEKTLTWNLQSNNKNEINYSFELFNFKNLIIVGGGALLLIIIIVVVILIAKKSKNKKNVVSTETPIHTDFDPSIANKVEETLASNTQVHNEAISETANIQVGIVPTVSEPTNELPEQKPANLEFSLPEEKTVQEIKKVVEENPIVKEQVFISPSVNDTTEQVTSNVQDTKVEVPNVVESNNIQEIKIETPDVVEMDKNQF